MLIIPNDVLLFRESRDFSAGEGHLARTTLPVPHAVTGAIRTAIFLKTNKSDPNNLVRPGEEEPGFEMLGVFMFFKGKELFTVPMDIVEVDEKITLVELHDDVITADGSIHFSPVTEKMITFEGLLEYLKGQTPREEWFVCREGVFVYENRIGVGLSKSKTTVEGLLYRTQNLRFAEEAGISVWLRKKAQEVKRELGERGVFKLGGEGRFAYYEFTDEIPWERLNTPRNVRKFKLYVATPLILEENGRSTWHVKKALAKELEIDKNMLHISAFFSDKPIPITGWDMANSCPKRIRYAVPSGSVYYIESDQEVQLPAFMKLGSLKNLGYGLVFTGVM